jgi:Spy/CpxP family protein refolding chaperone
MKRTTILFLAIALLGGATASQAQAPATPKPAATNAPAPRPIVWTRVDVMAQRLGLKDEQKARVAPILEEESKKLSDLRAKQGITPQERRDKYNTIREETNAKLKPILTPEQWEKHSKPSTLGVPAVLRPTNAVPATPAK